MHGRGLGFFLPDLSSSGNLQGFISPIEVLLYPGGICADGQRCEAFLGNRGDTSSVAVPATGTLRSSQTFGSSSATFAASES